MNDQSANDAPLDALVEEYVSRLRRGERPALAEYTSRRPELAEEICELFPMLVMMEEARPDHTNPVATYDVINPSTITGKSLERLGDYRILREIARGGMGIVYEAEQESLGRHVALKVLPPQAVLDPRHLQRFQREARAAAKLHHTNIVPVFGVGEHDGIYYYVMQFIPGLGLDQVLDELRRLRSAPPEPPAKASRNPEVQSSDREVRTHVYPADAATVTASAADIAAALNRSDGAELSNRQPLAPTPIDSATFRVRSPSSDPSGSSINLLARDTTTLSRPGVQYWLSVARIGVQVAEAIDYAFAQGVLHRDIKPSNLLLDTHGTVWVTDFGLAKESNSADLTHASDIVGTLRYLAPERLRGEVNLSGDLYSLGVTLYEMLILRPPFQDQDRSRLLRRISEEEPTRPREIDADIPHDLETIVMKALAKDPIDRYATAAEMADDLRQFLEDKPIAARRIGSRERVWRWCRRNPRVAALLGSVAMLLVFIAVGSSVAAVWLKRERDSARTSEAKATKAERAQRQELYRAYLSEARASYLTGRQGQRLNGMRAIENIVAAFPPEELTASQRSELHNEAISYLALPDLREVSRIPTNIREPQGLDVNDTLEIYALPAEGIGDTVLRRLDDSGTSIDLPTDSTEPKPLRSTRTFSPSGRWLVEKVRIVEPTAQGKEIRERLRVWDWQAQRVVLDQPLIDGDNDLIFHPDDRHLMLPGRDAILHFYSLDTGQEERRSPARFHVNDAGFSHDGKSIAVCNRHLNTEIVDPVTWQTLATIPEVAQATSVAWNPVSPWLVLGGDDGRLFVWRLESGEGQFSLERHDGAVVDLQFSPDGSLLASSGEDNMIQIRHMPSHRMLLTAPGRALRFSRDGKRLAVLNDGELIVYELVHTRAYARVVGQWDAAEFSPDGRWLATSRPTGVQIHSSETLEMRADLALDHCGPVAFHPDGGSLLTFGIFSHVWTWPLRPPEPGEHSYRLGPARPVVSQFLQNRTLGVEPQHRGRHAAWSRNGGVLALADYRNGRVLTADSDEETPPQEFAKLLNAAQVAVSPDGAYLAAAASLYPYARVWSIPDRRVILDLPDQVHVAFSADGKWFAASSLQEVRLYRVASWKLERVFEIDEPAIGHTVPIAFQPGGSLLAVAVSLRQVRLFDCDTGVVAANLTHFEPAPLVWLSFSPDGARLAVTRHALDVAVWDLQLLRPELAELGIPCEGLPALRAQTADMGQQLAVERGNAFPQADHGVKTWLRLANYETIQGNWSDAIDDLSKSLRLLPAAAREERAEILTLRGQYNFTNQSLNAARADWEQALSLVPKSAATARLLGRLLLLGPPEHRDPLQAVGLIAGSAVDPDPNPEDLLLLGIAQVRLGRQKQGLATLQRVADVPAVQPLAPFFIAIAQWRLGRRDEARLSFDQADKWMQNHSSNDSESDPVRDEAAAILGVCALPE